MSSGRTLALRGLGVVGLAVSVPFVLWFVLGLLGVVPSLVQVYGMEGLRIPASCTVGGLLAAAAGFHDA